MSFEMTFEGAPMDGDCLILSGMEFQTVGAAKLKALRPMAVVVKQRAETFLSHTLS